MLGRRGNTGGLQLRHGGSGTSSSTLQNSVFAERMAGNGFVVVL